MKHELKILSLHDAQAECSCGHWYYAFTGVRTREEIEEAFRWHLSARLALAIEPMDTEPDESAS